MVGPLCMTHLILFCFVLFCHINIFQTMMLHARLLVASKSFQWVRVHWLGLKVFGTIVWKLLIIEPFFLWKLNKIEIENHIGIWGHLWCCRKTFGEPNLIEFISQFSKLRFGWYYLQVYFVVGNLNKLKKLTLERKISWTFNVFTLGPMTYTTLVLN
jgi:hypothetical protein